MDNTTQLKAHNKLSEASLSLSSLDWHANSSLPRSNALSTNPSHVFGQPKPSTCTNPLVEPWYGVLFTGTNPEGKRLLKTMGTMPTTTRLLKALMWVDRAE